MVVMMGLLGATSRSLVLLLTVVLMRAPWTTSQEAQMGSILPPIILGLGPDAQCPQECDFMYNPVCGSDGVSYPNYCFLARAACRTPGIRPLTYGPCSSPDPCNFVCDRSLRPVCGSDNRTYSNPCVLMYYSCYYPHSALVRRYFGRCAASRTCPSSCPRTKAPLCGSDGRTYENPCTLARRVCAGANIVKVKDGPCIVCPRPCTRVYLPVCGSDGMTYANQCVMESKVCDGVPAITKLYDGACST